MLSEKEVKKNIRELSVILSSVDSKKFIEGFFNELFTSAELKDIASRWAIIKALNAKIPQRKIAQEKGISLCKITRGSKELKKENGVLQKMLKVPLLNREHSF